MFWSVKNTGLLACLVCFWSPEVLSSSVNWTLRDSLNTIMCQVFAFRCWTERNNPSSREENLLFGLSLHSLLIFFYVPKWSFSNFSSKQCFLCFACIMWSMSFSYPHHSLFVDEAFCKQYSVFIILILVVNSDLLLILIILFDSVTAVSMYKVLSFGYFQCIFVVNIEKDQWNKLYSYLFWSSSALFPTFLQWWVTAPCRMITGKTAGLLNWEDALLKSEIKIMTHTWLLDTPKADSR